MRLIWVIAAAVAAFQANAGIEQQLAGCATVSDNLDRLTCYDKLAASVAANPAQAPLPAAAGVATEQAVTAPTGQPAPQPVQPAVVETETEFGIKRKAPAEDVDKIYMAIASIDRDPYGALIITFGNGQLWKQIDSRNYRLEEGETVFVKKAALRSFLLGTDSRNSTIRVKRLK